MTEQLAEHQADPEGRELVHRIIQARMITDHGLPWLRHYRD